MDFEVAGKVAGSSSAILSNRDVYDVYSLFGDKTLIEYGIDIRRVKTFMSAQTLRQVQSFVFDYGVDDAKSIVSTLFSPKYKGRLRGRAVGASVFAKNMRWFADQLLLEGGGTDAADVSERGFWDR